MCDALATEFLETEAQLNSSSPLFTTTKCHLYVNEVVVTSKLKNVIRNAYSLPLLKEYISKKNAWTVNEWNNVNWDAHSSALNKFYTKKRRLLQSIHNQLPTGTVMKRRLPTYDCICQACKTEEESNDHLFSCIHPEYKKWRDSLAIGLVNLCKSLNTDPVLIEIMLGGLEAEFTANTMSNTYQSQKYIELVQDQSDIGWHNVMKGRFSYKWDECQQSYLVSIKDKNKKTGKWSATVISFLFSKWFELWKIRNSHHHGVTTREKNERSEEKTTKEMEYLYANKEKVQFQNRDLFRESIEIHKEEPAPRKALWVKLFKELITKSKNHLQKTTTEDIRKYFFPVI
jgi:hypothetical protein